MFFVTLANEYLTTIPMPTSGEIERERLRKKREIVIQDLSKCYHCKSTGLTETDKFCPHCGFPQRGSKQEMWQFIRGMKQKDNLLRGHRKAVNKARNTLYFLSVATMVAGLVFGLIAKEKQGAIIITYLVIALVYLVLALWCKTNPFPAILSGFFLYIVLIVIGAIDNPRTLYNGLLIKIFIISAFIYGYKGVKEAEKLEKELETLKTSVDLNHTNALPELPE
jgi:hypothetical protein